MINPIRCLKKLRIHPLFIPFAVGICLTGRGRLFFALFCFVTIHECCHCLVAKKFGGKVSRFAITPIGERATLRGIDDLPYAKRQLILLVGPLSNLFFFCLFFVLGQYNGSFLEYAKINLLLAVFNLLPVFPLDGGRICHYYFGERIGYLKTAKMMVKMSRWFGYCLILLGVVQMILSPYEISFLVIGFYFVYANKREFLHIAYHTYAVFTTERKRNLSVVFVLLAEEKPLNVIIEEMNLEQYRYYLRKINGKLFAKTQQEMMKDLLTYGNFCSVFEVPWEKEVRCCEYGVFP